MKILVSMAFLLGFSICALGDGYTPTKQDGDPDFAVQEKQVGPSTHDIAVSIKAGPVVSIGVCDASNRIGVVAGSIQVHRLDGTTPLYHIEWLDHMQGMGAYYNCYFLLAPVSQPTNILARGVVPLHGRWGAGTGVSGSYSVGLVSNTLTIAKQQLVRDNSRKAKPLYHFREEKGWSRFSSLVDTTITRTYSVGHKGITPVRAELHYVTQDGDTLDAVCSGLKVKAEWIRNPRDIMNAKTKLVIILPGDEAEKLYPTVDRREP